MATRQRKQASSWLSDSKCSSKLVQLDLHGVAFTVDADLLAAKSAKLSALLKENPRADLSRFLCKIPAANPELFGLVSRFCHGYRIDLSAENVIPLSCLAFSLGMTDHHCPNNLLSKTYTFFKWAILPSWSNSIKALHTTEKVLQEASHLRLLDACLESISEKALANPHLLGEPLYKSSMLTSNVSDASFHNNANGPNARKRLFRLERQYEDLMTLPPKLYELLIQAIIHQKVPPPYIAASLCQYLKKWVRCSCAEKEDHMSVYKKIAQREVIEAVERLMPVDRGLLPCSVFSEMLHLAIVLEASSECRDRLELRIGKQLDQANVKDLMLPLMDSAKNIQSNIECVTRILKNFYQNYSGSDDSGIIAVAGLIEELLAELTRAKDLEVDAFVQLAEMLTATLRETQRSFDGVYKAIDTYLHKHKSLTQSEREKVCQMLDCSKLSEAARRHAAQNERLPMRVIVQVMFATQLQIRNAVTKDVKHSDTIGLLKAVEEDEEKEALQMIRGQEEVRREIEQMGNKVEELEKECYTMRRELNICNKVKKEESLSLWREVKRKLNCKSSFNDCKCQVKKKKMMVHHR